MDNERMDVLKIQIIEKELQLLVQIQEFAERYGKVYGVTKDMTPSMVHHKDTSDFLSVVTRKDTKRKDSMETHGVKVVEVKIQKRERAQESNLKGKRPREIFTSEQVEGHKKERDQEMDPKGKRPQISSSDWIGTVEQEGVQDIVMCKQIKEVFNSEKVRNVEVPNHEHVRNEEVAKQERAKDMKVCEQESVENMDVCNVCKNGTYQDIVEVDMEGTPTGDNRGKWLKCIRDHTKHIDWSHKFYRHDEAMLLTIKQHVDNIFEYKGGLGEVPDKVFLLALTIQFKSKKSYMKKAFFDGKEKPREVHMEQWLKLSKEVEESSSLKQTMEEKRQELKKKKREYKRWTNSS